MPRRPADRSATQLRGRRLPASHVPRWPGPVLARELADAQQPAMLLRGGGSGTAGQR